MPEITPEMTQQMGSMMKDPAMMKQMTGMMRNMDPAMLKQFGITDPSQLDQAAEQLEKLTPGQLEKLVTWGTRLQGVYIWYKKNAWVKYAGGVTITGLMYYTLGAWFLPAALLPASWSAPAALTHPAASSGGARGGAGVLDGPARVGEATGALLDDDEDEQDDAAEAGAPERGSAGASKGGKAFLNDNADEL
mmetsp:Transcript_49319/g.112319  ORF Transcript_49319/g.112319 Transcript_49319/m.112319 type:complete len:192 (+) Transcript_49319:3-578(+)